MSSLSKELEKYAPKYVPEPDAGILGDYMANLAEKSTETLRLAARSVTGFYETTNYISVVDARIEDMKTWTDSLKLNGCADATNNTMFLYVQAWFNVMKKAIYTRGITMINLFEYIENPFKKGKKKATSKKINLDLDHRDRDEDGIILTDEQMDEIVKCAANTKRWLYIALLILRYTGIRPAELITIRMENVDIKERVLGSGTEKNARKTGIVVFSLPPAIAMEVKAYMLGIDGEWLFPSARIINGHLCVATLQAAVHKISLKTKIEFTAYSFRHTIITRRRVMGITKDDNHVLMNHAPKDVEGRHYEAMSIRERRALYDDSNPYQ